MIFKMPVKPSTKTNNDLENNITKNTNVTKQNTCSDLHQKKTEETNCKSGHVKTFKMIKRCEESLEYRTRLLQIIEDLIIKQDLKLLLNYTTIIDKMYWLTLNIPLPSEKRIFSNRSVYSISFKERIFLKTIIEFFFKYNLKGDNFYNFFVEHIEFDFEQNLKKYQKKESFLSHLMDELEALKMNDVLWLDAYRTIDSSLKYIYLDHRKRSPIIDEKERDSELINFLMMFLYANPGFFISADVMKNAQDFLNVETSYQYVIGDLLQFCVNPDEFKIFKRMLKIICRIVTKKETTITMNKFVNYCYPVFDSSEIVIFNYFVINSNSNPKNDRIKIVQDMLSYVDENIPKWML